MSAGFKTMLQIEASIQYRFSVSGVSARHTPGSGGRIRALFNGSWRRLREMVSLASDGSYLLGTTPANLPTTATVTGDVYAEVDWPLDAIAIYGVRVQAQTAGRWYPLKRVPWAAFQDYQSDSMFAAFSQQQNPVGYCTRLAPDGAGAVETVGKVMIFPVPRGGQYRLWYLQAHTDRVADTSTFNGFADFFLWAELDTCIQMLSPDNDSDKSYTMWSRERDKAQALIEARAMNFEAGQAISPRDGRDDGYDFASWRDSL
jgi:hypothetical protein